VPSNGNGISCKVGISDAGVQCPSRVDLGHVGAERSDLAVGSAVGCVVVSSDDKDGLGEARSVKGDGGADGVWGTSGAVDT
jgi:hypothetical protein